MALIKPRFGKRKIRVDADLVSFLSLFKWGVYKNGKNFYAHTRVDGQTIAMHRLIMKPPMGMHVDHIDHDGLNNTTKNLRICTRSQNGYNRPRSWRNNKYLGVSKRKNGFAAVTHAGHRSQIHGIFGTEIKAAIARDIAAKRIWGDFAKLNFPKGVKMKTEKKPKVLRKNIIHIRLTFEEFSDTLTKTQLYTKGDISKLVRLALAAYRPIKKVGAK